MVVMACTNAVGTLLMCLIAGGVGVVGGLLTMR